MLTEEKNIEQLNSQIRFISHEIRNNLSICDMYSQIIKRNLEKDGVQNSSIDNAIECIQKSLQIICANIMDLKSINNSENKLYDFEKTVLKGVELSKAYTEDKDIAFEVFVKNTTNIMIDENRFLSCIINIIKNGIESIDIKGKITVLGEIKDGIAYLKISNDGKPIPKDKQEKIFEIGYTSKSSGSGLGLGICQKYLSSMGADLRLVKSGKAETQFEISIKAN
ncbi:HAMP domain-containing histidine kinase [bacterium]|nr:HAMP domain-containing histidine kinase [bacterium]